MCKTSEIKKKLLYSTEKSPKISRKKSFSMFFCLFSLVHDIWKKTPNYFFKFKVLCIAQLQSKLWVIPSSRSQNMSNFNELSILNMYFAFCLETLINFRFLVLPYSKKPTALGQKLPICSKFKLIKMMIPLLFVCLTIIISKIILKW